MIASTLLWREWRGVAPGGGCAPGLPGACPAASEKLARRAACAAAPGVGARRGWTDAPPKSKLLPRECWRAGLGDAPVQARTAGCDHRAGGASAVLHRSPYQTLFNAGHIAKRVQS